MVTIIDHLKLDKKQLEAQVALLEKDDIEDVLRLQDIVLNNIPNLEIYKPDSREFLIECMEHEGVVIGVIADGRLIAYRFINFPKYEKRNFGFDLHLPIEEIPKVAHFESALVHPEYVGNGLQRNTFNLSEKIVYDMGYYHICTLISPNNYYSLSNVLNMGLTIRKLKKKYADNYDGEGKYRFILYKNLKEEIKDYLESISLPNKDIKNQTILMEEGYIGYRILGSKDEFSIIYGK